jgi:hypothetical protein
MLHVSVPKSNKIRTLLFPGTMENGGAYIEENG